MEVNVTKEILVYSLGCSPVNKGEHVEEGKKGRSAGCILVLVKAMQLTPKSTSTLTKLRSMKRIVLCRILDVLGCGKGPELSFIHP